MSINRGAGAGKGIKESACITEDGSPINRAGAREGIDRSAACSLRDIKIWWCSTYKSGGVHMLG